VTSVTVIGIGSLLLVAFLHAPDLDAKKRLEIHQELLAFKGVMYYYISLDRVPPPTLDGLLAEYKGAGLKYARSDRDPWGSPFFYNVRIVAEGEVDTAFELTIRSSGPNGRDELGKGDDIQVVHAGRVIRRRAGTSNRSQPTTACVESEEKAN
jgi:hypothetical protein